jgi:hypothetical protein
MLRSFPMAAALCIFATLSSLWVLAALPVAAKPAKNRSAMVPTTKQGAVPTDRTPTNRNDCLVVAQALNEKAKTLSSGPNRVSRESLFASHQTSMCLVASRILVRPGSASSG